MTSLERQISALAAQLEQRLNELSIDEAVAGVTIERHRPGNGSTYIRLRVPKGRKLPNGKRTMGLDAEGAAEWEQKLYARNQQVKLAQCLTFIQQAAEVAEGISEDFGAIPHFGELPPLVKGSGKATKVRTQQGDTGAAVTPEPSPPISYVLKDAKGATPMNRKVHAITEAEPASGRWYGRALCGEKPKAGSWGWLSCNRSALSCSKCAAQLKALAVP